MVKRKLTQTPLALKYSCIFSHFPVFTYTLLLSSVPCYKIKVSRKNVHSIQAWHFSLAKRKHFSNVSSWSLISVCSCHKNFLLIGQCWDTDDSSQKYNLSQQILKRGVRHSFPKFTLLAPVPSIIDITKWFSQNTVANCPEGESIECKNSEYCQWPH